MPSRSPFSNPRARSSEWLLPALLCVLLASALLWPTAVVLPPYLVLEGVFRAVIYPLLTGEQSRRFPHPRGIYFIVLTPIAVGLLILLYRRLTRTRGTYRGRAARAFGLIVLVMYLLNHKVQGGLGIPLALCYAAALVWLCWEGQRADWARRVLEGAVWVGLGFLVSSAAVIAAAQGEPRFELQRLHGLYGYLWMAAAAAYLIAHVTYYEAKRETSSRNWGFVAIAVLTAAALTGVARLHGGGETAASGLWPHVTTGIAAVVAVAVHVFRSWRKRGLTVQLGPGHAPGTFVLACMGLGVALPVLPVALAGLRPAVATPARAAVDALRASPEAPITASGPNGTVLPLNVVSGREAEIGCGRNGGCHVDIQAQWERSAHRFSANPAYRRTVRLLVEEEGVERARLCAGCHDPVPLLSGQIVAGADYPFEDSEGVTCVVCHSMEPGPGAKNGEYTVVPSATFHGSVKDRFTAYMMIELYRREHRDDFLGASLTDSSMCASCHNLTTEHLVLRRTFDEWSAGPFGPGSASSKSCTGCHMPPVGDSYLGFFDLHDHRVPAANVALAGLRGESAETERAFIAAALDLQLSVARAAEGAFQIDISLTNKNGAHVFPTAPRDLLDYWFEVQFETDGPPTSWLRVDSAGLFPEKLIDGEGDLLIRHEIWSAVEKQGPEGIAPGATQRYSYRLPPAPADVRRVSVRLMHRRYQDAFLDFLGPDTGGLYTVPIEVLRRTAEWPGGERIAAR